MKDTVGPRYNAPRYNVDLAITAFLYQKFSSLIFFAKEIFSQIRNEMSSPHKILAVRGFRLPQKP